MILTFNDEDSILHANQRHIRRADIDTVSFALDENYLTLSSTSAKGRKFVAHQSAEALFIENETGRFIKITVGDFRHFAEALTRGGGTVSDSHDLRGLVDHVQRLAFSEHPVKHSIRGEEGYMKVLSGRHVIATGDDWNNQFTIELDLSMRTGKKAKAKVFGKLGTDVATLNFSFTQIDTIEVKKKWLILKGKTVTFAARSIEVFSFENETLTYDELLRRQTPQAAEPLPDLSDVINHWVTPLADMFFGLAG